MDFIGGVGFVVGNSCICYVSNVLSDNFMHKFEFKSYYPVLYVCTHLYYKTSQFNLIFIYQYKFRMTEYLFFINKI